MHGFWDNLPKPFFALAPMEDVTDAAFRRVVVKRGKPDVFFTEFTSADGLCSQGVEQVAQRLMFSEAERPIVAQIWSHNPDMMYKASSLIKERNFDGIDINMGCPDRAVCAAGAGAALIKDVGRAREIISAAKEGGSGLPVSVKTRTGFDERDIEGWIGKLLDAGLAAITVHARTKKEKSLVPARWHDIARVVEMAKGTGTLIIGNGDITDMDDARAKCQMTGADGAMLGRAVIGNPWLFNAEKKEVSLQEKLAVMCEHARLFEEIFTGQKNFSDVRKHLHAYAHGFAGAKQLRLDLMEAKNAEDIEKIVGQFQSGILMPHE